MAAAEFRIIHLGAASARICHEGANTVDFGAQHVQHHSLIGGRERAGGGLPRNRSDPANRGLDLGRPFGPGRKYRRRPLDDCEHLSNLLPNRHSFHSHSETDRSRHQFSRLLRHWVAAMLTHQSGETTKSAAQHANHQLIAPAPDRLRLPTMSLCALTVLAKPERKARNVNEHSPTDPVPQRITPSHDLTPHWPRIHRLVITRVRLAYRK